MHRPVNTTGTRLPQARVLLVEDESDIREALASAYLAAGHRVIALPDGADFRSACYRRLQMNIIVNKAAKTSSSSML